MTPFDYLDEDDNLEGITNYGGADCNGANSKIPKRTLNIRVTLSSYLIAAEIDTTNGINKSLNCSWFTIEVFQKIKTILLWINMILLWLCLHFDSRR